MRLRLDGSETRFEDAWKRAPWAPLIHIVLLATDAFVRFRRAREQSAHTHSPAPSQGDGPLPSGG